MEKVIDFIVSNWQLCVYCVLLVANLVLFLLKKKPVDTLKAELIQFVIGFINSAEKLIGAGNGEAKKEAVLKAVQEWFNQNYPKVDVTHYIGFVDELIEYILSTPQKKGE